MNQHTPGPWRIGQTVQNDGSIAIMAEDGRIGLADDFETPIGAANARLIAAAPDLKVALWDAAELIKTVLTTKDNERRQRDRLNHAYSIIHEALSHV